MVNGSVHHEASIIINMHKLNIEPQKTWNKKINSIKEEIDNSSTVVADISTPLSITDKITTRK